MQNNKKQKNSIVRRQERKKHFGRIFTAVTLLVLVTVLSVRMVNLYNKLQAARATEKSKEAEKQEQLDKSKELKSYEKYTKTKDYVEDTAKSKLGMVHQNEIIFREKD